MIRVATYRKVGGLGSVIGTKLRRIGKVYKRAGQRVVGELNRVRRGTSTLVKHHTSSPQSYQEIFLPGSSSSKKGVLSTFEHSRRSLKPALETLRSSNTSRKSHGGGWYRKVEHLNLK